jgi:hypothetical protein
MQGHFGHLARLADGEHFFFDQMLHLRHRMTTVPVCFLSALHSKKRLGPFRFFDNAIVFTNPYVVLCRNRPAIIPQNGLGFAKYVGSQRLLQAHKA